MSIERLNLVKSYPVGPTNVYLIDDSRPHWISDSRCEIVWSRAVLAVSRHKTFYSTPTLYDHKVWDEHFVDDVNDAVISTHVGPYDMRTVDLNALQQGGSDGVFHDVAVGI